MVRKFISVQGIIPEKMGLFNFFVFVNIYLARIVLIMLASPDS